MNFHAINCWLLVASSCEANKLCVSSFAIHMNVHKYTHTYIWIFLSRLKAFSISLLLNLHYFSLLIHYEIADTTSVCWFGLYLLHFIYDLTINKKYIHICVGVCVYVWLYAVLFIYFYFESNNFLVFCFLSIVIVTLTVSHRVTLLYISIIKSILSCFSLKVQSRL